MLSPELSPVHALAVKLAAISPHQRTAYSPAGWRQRIWQAAAEEETVQQRSGGHYDPSTDKRVAWALAWACVLEGSLRRIPADLQATMEFLCRLGPRTLSAKELAAGEPLTLAQGS